jgi:NitT/TauT family transport system permease protein
MKYFDNLFELRANLNKKQILFFEVFGLISFLIIWQLFAMKVNSNAILPGPISIISCLPELHFKDLLVKNIGYSLKLNLLAYAEAIIFAIPLGFLLGVFTPLGAIFKRLTDSVRYIPLTAVTGIFIAWFGIYFNMKLQFLAFGIFIYLLPIVIQRVNEVEQVYVQTAQTLGASKWQIIRKVFWPSVLSRVSNDIIVITAISWTYIIVAELVNNEGGIGSLIFRSQRQSRLDKVFACLLIIILIGMIQDKVFTWLDKMVFKYKYVQQGNK